MTVERKVDLFRMVEVEEQNGEMKQREEVFGRLTLMDNVTLVSQRWTNEGWSGSFRYFDQEEFILRERASGTIEIEYQPYNPVSGKLMEARRKRTGEKNIADALTVAIKDFIHEEHKKRVLTGGVELDEGQDATLPNTVADPCIEDCAILIRALGLLHKNKKTRAHEEKILDFFTVVWGDRPQSHLSNRDVAKIYEIRRAGFKWPPRFKHRKVLKAKPKPVTVQMYLETLKTLLNRLKGANHKLTGDRYLISNRLEDLDLGNHAKGKRPAAHPHRYGWVYQAADEAVEIVRANGVDRSYWEQDEESGKLVLHEMRRYMTDVIPGIARAMLMIQYGHGMRVGSWRRIRMDDLTVEADGVADLIVSLRLEDHDEDVSFAWADVWAWGAIVYRKEYLKGKADRRYERIVPLSEKMQAELRLYLQRRKKRLKQLKVTSPWLFPSPTNPAKPISDEDARELLYAAEELAREQATEARGATYARKVLRDLYNTAWYAYRRTWKDLRNARGWFQNKNANYVGGWSTKVGQISEVVYAQLLPEFILAVVEGLSVVEAVKRYGETDELAMAIDVAPEGLPGTA